MVSDTRNRLAPERGLLSPRRAVLGGLLVLLVTGCLPQAGDDGTALDVLIKDRQLRDRAAETVVWLDNRTGEPVREVGMSCRSVARAGASRSYATRWTRETTVEGGPKEIWREKYPDPLVLESLKVRFDKGARCEYQLNHTCQPGDRVVIVLDAGGGVKVEGRR